MKIVMILLLMALAVSVHAFEVKGITPGMSVEQLDTANCVKGAEEELKKLRGWAHSGFVCNTTVGGDQAQLTIMVFDDKVMAAMFEVRQGDMRSVLAALEGRYGMAWQPNRFIKEYQWERSKQLLKIGETRLGRGYTILLLDLELRRRADAVAKAKAEKDL